MKILIAEDNPMQREIMQTMLESLGYQDVIYVESGTEALQVLRTHPIDLAILDIRIKGELDGIQVAQKIPQYTTRQIPVIFITSSADIETFRRANVTNPVAYLSKPYDRLALQRAIEMAVFRIGNNAKPTGPETFSWEDMVTAESIFLKINRKILKVQYKEITYLEAEDKYTNIYLATKQDCLLVRISLSDIMEKIPVRKFVRVSRKVVINTEHIEEVSLETNLVRVGGVSFQIGRTFREELLKKLRIVG